MSTPMPPAPPGLPETQKMEGTHGGMTSDPAATAGGTAAGGTAVGGAAEAGASGPRRTNTPMPDSMLMGEGQEAPPEGVYQPVDFWRQPWVQNVLPLATSLALHLALIVIGYATYKAVEKVATVVKEQIIIPESTLAETGPPGGIPHPGLGGDPTRDAAQDLIKETQDSGWSAKASDQLNQAVLGGSAPDAEASSITVGANAITGKGEGIGGAGGQGGQLAPFGVPGGGNGAGPKSSFVGVGGNARKVLYFCDASGSMLPVFDELKNELKKSIDGLKAIQAFNVVFYSDSEFTSLSKEGLVMATPENKRKAYEFIDGAVSSGLTQPVPAIKFSLAQKPELMYLLTDGFDNISSFDEVINAFRTGNPEHKIKVNCIFLQSSDDPKLVDVLKQISRENGGLVKIISKSDF